MKITEEHYWGIINRVLHEGRPELAIGPIDDLPVGIPPAWTAILTTSSPRAAALDLWRPMNNRLPRVCQALYERLLGVGLLRTEEVPVSLLYFFGDGDFLFQYRGQLPALARTINETSLPTEYQDFYRIHDGWVLLFSEDDGPAPLSDCFPLASLWTDVDFMLPPGIMSTKSLRTVFRSGNDFALAYDNSSSSPKALLCYNDGTVEPLLDMWFAIDRQIAEFLEELDLVNGIDHFGSNSTEGEWEAAYRLEQLLQTAEQSDSDKIFRGAAWHEQVCAIYSRRALLELHSGSQANKAAEFNRKALAHWCLSLENGAETDPREVIQMFAIAHEVDDSRSAGFVAALPPTIWTDETIESLQVQLLLDLYRCDFRFTENNIEALLGLTFDDDGEVKPHAEIIANMIY